MNTIHAQLPSIRSGKEYIANHADLMARAREASKTDNDTDYREDVVQTTAFQAQLSSNSVSSSTSKWDDYDNVRTDRTSYRQDGGQLLATESSVVDMDTCDHNRPFLRTEGVARTLTIDLNTGEIVGQRTSTYDAKADLWS